MATMADDVASSAVALAAASPPNYADDEGASSPPGKKTLPPLSKDITAASAMGTSSTYTDYSLIAFQPEAEPSGRDDNGGAAASGHGGHGSQGENFPTKLHRMLSRPDLSHIISWLDHGRAWKVHDQDAFASVVVPEYFNHNKYTSFSRQVNGWGFRRMGSGGKDHTAYYHELFLRGMPHLVKFMRRPGPVPPRKGEVEETGKGAAGGEDGAGEKKKSSRIGRRRRTAADKGNEPDFHLLGEARPLPVENPPGHKYSAGDNNAAGAVSSAAAARSIAAVARGKTKKNIMKHAIAEVVSKDRYFSDFDDEEKALLPNWGSEASFHGAKKTKTTLQASSAPDVCASGAGFLAPEIRSVGATAAAAHGGGGGFGFGGDGMSNLLDQQMKLMEMQKQVMAQMLPQQQQQLLLQQAHGQGLGFLAGNHPQGHAGQVNLAAASQMHKSDASKYVAAAQATPSATFDLSSLNAHSMPLKSNYLKNDDRMDISPKIRPKEAPLCLAASPPDDDDFDKELDELAGFLGNVDNDMMDVEDSSLGGMWSEGDDDVAAAEVSTDSPPKPSASSVAGGAALEMIPQQQQRAASVRAAAHAYPAGLLLPAAAAVPQYDARVGAQGGGIGGTVASAGNNAQDVLRQTTMKMAQQQQQGMMFGAMM